MARCIPHQFLDATFYLVALNIVATDGGLILFRFGRLSTVLMTLRSFALPFAIATDLSAVSEGARQ